MSEESSKKSISIDFEGVEEAPRVPTSGVWGGISNDGLIWAALYHEHGSIPDVVKLSVDERGNGTPTEERISTGDATRDVQVVTQMSPDQALSIGKWLIEKGLLSLKEVRGVDLDDVELEIEWPNGG